MGRRASNGRMQRTRDLTYEQWVVVCPLKGISGVPTLTLRTGRMDRHGAIVADVPSRTKRKTRHTQDASLGRRATPAHTTTHSHCYAAGPARSKATRSRPEADQKEIPMTQPGMT